MVRLRMGGKGVLIQVTPLTAKGARTRERGALRENFDFIGRLSGCETREGKFSVSFLRLHLVCG